jgi:TnsA endonuclease N terminal
MAYSGKFSLKNTNKYLGDPTNIWYRSLWERRVMVRLDDDPNVIEWSNEEIIIPYLSPIDGRWHRYFPDFFVRVRNRNGVQEAMILEVKPLKQSIPPPIKKRITRQYIQEVATFGINEAKWKAADEYCKNRGWTFKVITEKDLGI